MQKTVVVPQLQFSLGVVVTVQKSVVVPQLLQFIVGVVQFLDKVVDARCCSGQVPGLSAVTCVSQRKLLVEFPLFLCEKVDTDPAQFALGKLGIISTSCIWQSLPPCVSTEGWTLFLQAVGGGYGGLAVEVLRRSAQISSREPPPLVKRMSLEPIQPMEC